MTTNGISHGLAGYVWDRCRCDACRTAEREYRRARRARTTADEIPHGTVNGYDHHQCRCDRCREAKQERRAERITWERTQASLIHGDYEHGWHRGCHCEPCMDAMRSRENTRRAGPRRKGTRR